MHRPQAQRSGTCGALLSSVRLAPKLRRLCTGRAVVEDGDANELADAEAVILRRLRAEDEDHISISWSTSNSDGGEEKSGSTEALDGRR